MKVATPECCSCVAATMANGPIKYKIVLISVPCTMIITNIMVFGSPNYFALFIEDDSGNSCAVRRKSKGDPAIHFVKYVRWMGQETGKRLKNIVLYDDKKSFKATQRLKSDSIDIDKKSQSTPQENG